MTEIPNNTETKVVIQSTVPESYKPIVERYANENDWSLAKASGKLIEFALLHKGLLPDPPLTLPVTHSTKPNKAKKRRTS